MIQNEAIARALPRVTSRGVAFTEDLWVTTGSYTGMYFPEAAGTAVGKFDGLPEIRLRIEAR